MPHTDVVADVAPSPVALFSRDEIAHAPRAIRAKEVVPVVRGIYAHLNEALPSSRGRRHARWAIDRATGIPESTLEHLSLAVIEWLGFPAPELQKWILGSEPGDDDRLDFWWPATRTAGEADGDTKYAGKDAVAVLRDRRDRDARLLERGVSATAHWGWHDVSRVAPLRAALLAAGLQPELPADTVELRSLMRLLSPPPGAQPASGPTSSARQQ